LNAALQNLRGRLPSPTRRHFMALLVLLASSAVAVFLGMVVTTANPLLMVVVLSPLAGLLLLGSWRTCFWGAVIGFLFINGPLQQFLPGLGKLTWAFSGLSLLLMVIAFVHMAGREDRNALPRAPVAWLVLLFLIAVLSASAIISGRPGELLAGFKRYFQTWGLFFALAVLPVAERDLRRLVKALIVVAALHLPFALYQFMFVMPAWHLRSAATFDVVVGLFEGGAEGGGASGVMSLYLVTFIAIAFRNWLANRMNFWQLGVALLILGVPLTLGETKAVVVILPFALLLAAQGYYGTPRSWLLLTAFGALIFALGVHYVTLNEVNGANFWRALDRVLAYNFGRVGYDGSPLSLNRSSVLSHWWSQHGMHKPVQTLFGHGLGASYFAASALAPGHLFLEYPFFNINLTTLSTLLWDLGLVGLLGFLLLLLTAWRELRLAIAAAKPASWEAELFRATEISLLVSLLSLPYNNSIISFGSHGTVLALTLGITAWAWRWRHAQPATGSLRQR
jgi:hypothetical protein